MDYPQLREIIKKWEKFPGCIQIPRIPIINKGYPGTFNLSFTEGPFMDEFGQYQDFDHDFIFSTIQSVVRPDDIFKTLPKNPERYLGVFEMADIYGSICLKEKTDILEIQRKQINSTVSLLKKVGIPLDKIYPKYCTGGKIKEITKDKYRFDFLVPEDTITKNTLLEAGVPEKNLIPDKTQDTFLSLFLHRPSPWGYRTEIEIDVGNKEEKLLDVATIEYLLWFPVFRGDTESKNIIGLKDINHTLALSVVGVERLYMASKGIEDIREVDYLKTYYELFKKEEDKIQGELVRTLHFICSDVKHFGLDIRKHRGWMVNKMVRQVTFGPNKIKKLLEVNVERQLWHKYLNEGIEPTLSFFADYRDRIK
jgi:hypothetical protein